MQKDENTSVEKGYKNAFSHLWNASTQNLYTPGPFSTTQKKKKKTDQIAPQSMAQA